MTVRPVPGLAQQLEAIQLHVGVAGMQIQAELTSRDEISLIFGESIYEFLDEPTLEGHLAQIARLLHAEWLRRYRRVIAESALDIHPHDQRDRDFVTERAQITSRGSSDDGIVSLSSSGLRDITVTITRGTLRRLSEEAFSVQFGLAAKALISDQLRQVRELRRRIYA